MNSYVCPYCRGHLRVGEVIVFLTKTIKGESGLILLSPKIGDYTVITHPSYNFDSGDHVNFICPICYENLDAKEYSKNLAKVIMIEEETNREFAILFSKIVGEMCTYKVAGGDFQAFGGDSNSYTNFFGEEPKY
ncbi:MAG: hypothetical protein KKA07_07105 [Bacteroidetes bacterium]|nr:hypothetical protein [Bacteroidota bacterium]MBU1718827.1 hypothetical protein [Bacteroidota bacterium]